MVRALLFVAWFTAVAAAAEPREDFLKGLGKVRTQLERGRYGPARSALDRLLKAHAEQNYVRAEKDRVRDLMKLAAFHSSVGKIDPKSVVSGKLKKYNARTGYILLVYSYDQLKGDWTIGKEGVLVFSGEFIGPHRVEVLGDRHPDDHISIWICYQGDRAYRVIVGAQSQTKYWRPTIQQYTKKSGTRTLMEGDTSKSPYVGSKYRIGASVQRAHIDALFNGRPSMRARKYPSDWGVVAIMGAGQVRQVVIQGTTDPAWMTGRIDAERQKRLKAFEKTYDEKKVLPRWLFTWPPAAPSLAKAKRPEWPASLSAPDKKLMRSVKNFLKKRRFKRVLDLCKGESALHAHLRSRAHWDVEDYEACLRETNRVLGKFPDFVPALEQQAGVLGILGQAEEAKAILDPLLAKYPGDVGLHETAVLLLLRSGRLHEATQVIDAALFRGVVSKLLERDKKNLNKSVHGPLWLKRYTVESKHYKVVTDISRKRARDAANALEQNYAGFSTRLERVPDLKKRKFMVYLFSGGAGYARYSTDLYGHAHRGSAGLYDPLLKQLLIRSTVRKKEMIMTVRHEGFHQYLDRLMVHPPLWFNEGLAEYFEVAKVVRGKWTLGLRNKSHHRWVPKDGPELRKFLYLDAKTFMADAARNYGRAWSFIHLLRHGKSKHKKLFRQFWKVFKATPSNRAALDQVLEGVSLEQLRDELEAHAKR